MVWTQVSRRPAAFFEDFAPGPEEKSLGFRSRSWKEEQWHGEDLLLSHHHPLNPPRDGGEDLVGKGAQDAGEFGDGGKYIGGRLIDKTTFFALPFS